MVSGNADECIEFSRLNKLNARLNGRTDCPANDVHGVDQEASGNRQRTSAGLSSPNSPLVPKGLQLARSKLNGFGNVLSTGVKNGDNSNGSPNDESNILMNECRVQPHRDSGLNAVSNNGGLHEQSANRAASEPPESNNLDHHLACNVKPNLINRNQITRLFYSDEPICSPLHTLSMAGNLRHYLAVRLSCCLMIDQQLIKYLAIQASRTLAPNRLNLDQDSAEI